MPVGTVRFDVNGIERVKEALASLSPEIIEAADDGQYEAAKAILGEAIDECPWKTGDLRRSGDVSRINEGAVRRIIIGFYKEYALVRHEQQEGPKTHWPIRYSHIGTKSKYLEDPLRRNEQKVMDFIEMRIREVLSG
jgi:hypothetical protein